MDEIGAKQFDELRDRRSQQAGSDDGLRRTSRTRKVPREYAEYLNEIHSKGLKHELLKLSQIIEVSTESLKTYDYSNIETTEIEKTLDTIHSKWVKYLKVHEDYSQLINNTRDLERLSIQRQSLERKINECNQLAIGQLNKSIRSLQRDSKFENGLHLKDDDKLSVSVQSSVSMSRSSKSRRSGGSSVSSRVKTAARSAELARLKLEQAERRAKAKEKQMQEQIECELQDLRDQAEYSQLEAELLAADQADERYSDCGSMRSLSKTVTGNRVNMKVEVKNSTPQDRAFYKTDHPSTRPELVKSPPESVVDSKQGIASLSEKCNDMEPSSPEFKPSVDKTKPDLTTTLLEMNQQLISVMKQGTETTTVMKAMLQRQGIPKPQPMKFRGDPAQFPVFKNRVEVWLNKREFDEREKITRLLSFVEGDARDAIEHCELKSNGFSEAMKILESQYGHPSSVVKASLKRVTVGPRIERGDNNSLAKLRNNLRSCLEVLKDNENYKHEINASSNVERVVDRLPMHMQIEWVKKLPKIRDETKLNPTLQHVLELVERQLRIMNDPQYGHILTTKRKPIDPKNKLPKPPPKPPLQNQISTLTTNLENSGLCPCCKGKHSLTNCDSFVKKTPEERWEI
ncbi:Hypothetical predicted protein, partial [Paramuricea clavata]